MNDPTTEIKRDADYLGNRLQANLKLIESCVVDLTRQGNKLFGYQPVPEKPKDILSQDNPPIVDLLDYIDQALIELRSQANRF